MSVILETSKGDIIIDVFVDECPKAATNFLKLCKLKYYNNCLFYNVQSNFIVQTGDPTNTGKGGDSVYGLLYGDQARFFEDEIRPSLKHKQRGMVGMASIGEDANASQFYITMAPELQSLDEKHTIFGEVAEGWEVLEAINEAPSDDAGRPLQNIRHVWIRHTIVLDDPTPDPPGLESHVPDASPEPQYADDGRLEDDWIPDEDARPLEEIERGNREKEARNRAVVLEMIGDLPEAEAKPPPDMLFVCKLHPVTTEEDLETIFSRFGRITSCDIIRDWKTGDSLSYAFIGFDTEKACEEAYFKMNNVLIDDRRIKVDFSQSVHHLWRQFKKFGGKGNGDLAGVAAGHERGEGAGTSGRLELKDRYRGQLHALPSGRGPHQDSGYGLLLGNEEMAKPMGMASLPSQQRVKPVSVRVEASNSAATPAPKEGSFLGIAAFTWQKIIPLGLMFFCILFNYTILRDTKDVLVVTAPGSGAEIIPFLKTWVNLPMAIGFTILYTKLANVLNNEQLFYVCIIPFLAFFSAFAFLLYPLRDILHPTEWATEALAQYGPRFAGPLAIVRNWTFCLFYVMAELWGSVVVSVLFWGFANQITTVDEAKQFYPLFGLGANVALIFSGRAVKWFSQIRANLPPGVDGWGLSLKGMMGMVTVAGLLIVAIFYYLNRTVVPRVQGAIPKRTKKKKEPMSVSESFTFLAKSAYIRNLATLVVAYGISINLVEVTWKSKIKQQFPNPNDYSAFMGDFSTATGAVTFTMMLVSRWIFSRFGWGMAALITPTVLLITGVVFFALVLFSTPLTPMLATLGMTPLFAAVLVGAAQNIFSKSSKYSLFDPCKEMAYIPLDDETKTKGKAAIDVICNPLGKSGGALIQQFMIIGFGSLASSTPYLGVILLVIVAGWIAAARDLDWRFSAQQAEMAEAKLETARADAKAAGTLPPAA